MTDPDPDEMTRDEDSLPAQQFESKLVPIWRMLAYLFVWAIGVSIASSFVYPFVSDLRPVDLGFLAATAIPNAVATVLITIGFVKYIDKRPVSTLGLVRRGTWLAELGFGVGLGLVMVGVLFLIFLAAGWANVTGSLFRSSPATIARMLLRTLVMMVGIAVTEEVAIRGYILQNLRSGYGAVAGLIISSAIFGFFHLANPGAGTSAFVGTLAAGLVLGFAYLATNRLWLPIGLHFGWNFALGPIFGFPVSGVDIPGWLMQNGRGPALWTGGQFGPEAGVSGIVALVLGAFAVWWFRRHWYRAGEPVLETAAEPSDDEIDGDRKVA